MIWLFQPLNGNGYQFWSGIGSDFGELTIITAIVVWWKTHECHVDGCHRFGKHPFQHYKLCKKHHPAVPDKVTHTHVKKLHKDSLDIYER